MRPSASRVAFRHLEAANWDLWAKASKLTVAMIYDDKWAGEDARFVWGTVIGAPRDNDPVADDPETWERLLRTHKSTLSKIPGRVGVKFNSNGMVMPGKGTDRRADAWIQKNMEFFGPFLSGRLDPNKVKQEQAEDKKEVLEAFDTYLNRFPDHSFMQSLRGQFDRKGWLSEKQLDSASMVLINKGMGPEANVFNHYQKKMQRERRAFVDPVAPSAEGAFFNNPQKREVREFGETGAMTNDPEVLQDMTEAPKGEAALVKETPPTPTEIVEEPGGTELGTLNRFVVETEQDIPGLPEGHDEVEKHPDITASLHDRWFGHK
jgi:hypothetical protein